MRFRNARATSTALAATMQSDSAAYLRRSVLRRRWWGCGQIGPLLRWLGSIVQVGEAITADRLGQDCAVSAPGMRAPWAASAAPVIRLSQRS